jgi:hypothetical protein
MTRQKLLALVSALGLIATTACADLTGPRHDDPPPKCPDTGGPDCKPT